MMFPLDIYLRYRCYLPILFKSRFVILSPRNKIKSYFKLYFELNNLIKSPKVEYYSWSVSMKWSLIYF
jgi:hypothetical protein